MQGNTFTQEWNRLTEKLVTELETFRDKIQADIIQGQKTTVPTTKLLFAMVIQGFDPNEPRDTAKDPANPEHSPVKCSQP